MFDVLLEVVFPAIGRLIGFFFVEVLIHMVCYTTGFVLCRILTLGRFPRQYTSWLSDDSQELLVNTVGFMFWFGVFVYYMMSR